MVVPTFVRQALAGEPVTVFGDGLQSRCFGWVGDVVNAIIALVEHPEAVGTVFNIGSDEDVTILELAQRVKDIARSDSPINFLPYDQAYEAGFEDMHRRIPSLERIRKLIGYQPTKTLDQMLEAIIKERETWIRPADVRTPASTQQSEVQPAS